MSGIEPRYDHAGIRLFTGDARSVLRDLPDGCAQMCVTSPPFFGLRDYGTATWEGGDPACDHAVRPSVQVASSGLSGGTATQGHQREGYGAACAHCGARRIDQQIGLEANPADYLSALVAVFREIKRVLRPDGTLWVEIGDSYASGGTGPQSNVGQRGRKSARTDSLPGYKPKDLMLIPFELARALRDDGWYLRAPIIWQKPAAMPESVRGSHWKRHKVTIEEYERLSGLPFSSVGCEANWSGDVPYLPPTAQPGNKAAVSAKRKGQSHGAGTRGATGREREASAGLSVSARANQQDEVRADREGPRDCGPEICEVSSERTRQGEGSGEAPADEGFAGTHCPAPSGKRSVHADGEIQGQTAPGVCAPEGGGCSGPTSDSGGLAGDSRSAQAPLPLLRREEAAHGGSRHTDQQRRASYQNEPRSRVPKLQFEEEGSHLPSLLVDCPGCPKCEENAGYIFNLSAGRVTIAHSYVWMLAKSERYFYCADAIAEPYAMSSWSAQSDANGQTERGEPGKRSSTKGLAIANGAANGQRYGASSFRNGGYTAGARNARSVWSITHEGFDGAHFATFPRELARRCILAGSAPGDTVIDPFSGAGTTCLVAKTLNRQAIGIELNPDYVALSAKRLAEPLLEWGAEQERQLLRASLQGAFDLDGANA